MDHETFVQELLDIFGGDTVSAVPSGGADYSAQWAEYYRSMGMMHEAEAIEAQMRGQRSGPSVAPAAQPAAAPAGVPGSNGAQNGGSADYSAQWADYYRSIGKVKEAEAIEAQMKQKVNIIIVLPTILKL